jgi:hypothetical protein
MSHIFLSYSGADRERVRPLVALLKDVAPVWWDQRIRHGDSWDETIERELNEASCVVVVWTEQSVKSRWVKMEARHGLKHRILVPVRLDAVDFPLEFSDVEAALLEGWDGSPHHPEAEMLKESVAAVIAQSGRGQKPSEPVPPEPWPRWLTWVAGAVVAGGIVGGVMKFSPRISGSGGDRTLITDTVTGTPVPQTPTVRVIIVSETGTPDVPSALGGAHRDVAGLEYHYIVGMDGSVHATRHVSQSDTAIAVGVVHAPQESRQHTSYPEAQLKALEGLLTMVAHEKELSSERIRSIGEIDPRYRRLHVTGRMPDVRARVNSMLGLWSMRGAPPAGAAIRIDTIAAARARL